MVTNIACRQLTLDDHEPLAVELFLVYQYTRLHNVLNQFRCAQFASASVKNAMTSGDVVLDSPREIYTTVDLASLAYQFGDHDLNEVMVFKLKSQLQLCTVDHVLDALIKLYTEPFGRLPNIEALRRVVVVTAIRCGFRDITHDLWQDIGDLIKGSLDFKNDLRAVGQAMCEDGSVKRANIERTATP